VGSPAFRDKLDAEKKKRTVQLLFKAARLLNDRAIARTRERMGKPVRAVHTSLLPHIDLEGTRLTDIAKRVGITKQAAGQLVDELEAMGLLERIVDPRDARAKLVRFSRRGQAAMLEGLGVLGELEAEMREVVGDAKMRAMHDALAMILASIEQKGPTRQED
jgi:DNA-binding MarR family transcriptional regulator